MMIKLIKQIPIQLQFMIKFKILCKVINKKNKIWIYSKMNKKTQKVSLMKHKIKKDQCKSYKKNYNSCVQNI